ncbi:DNA polymerase III subunit alpha [Frondihabitans sp. PAMC 28766]|uniref:DNA polymerase III subunit alpha n=1 Tax=Frondihabitans sp. PAMC 28766 TaxID=1795630 RepID=UPI00078BFE85|nr:DNA polymerase III subunit alpha [Frondihabitans sp. PAMC 28766]AMM21109.1 DNA polymerase III subunit alpha [Frondihabitans sp. PAMC 28766]
MSFTHLHVASSFSAHFGTASPLELAGHVASHGADAAAITDRDGLYGAIRHINACKVAGIDPIVGVELGVSPEATASSSTTRQRTAAETDRVVVLAHGRIDGAGWASMCRLISAAHGRATRKVSGSANSVATIAHSRIRAFLVGEDGATGTVLLGPDSDVGRAVARGEHSVALALLADWCAMVPGGIVIEVVCHFTEPGESRSLRHASRMLELADQTGVPAILTNAVRYRDPDGAVTADVLDAAGHLQALGTFLPQPNAQAWLKGPGEMRELALQIAGSSSLDRSAAEAMLRATEELADRCRLDPDGDLGWRRAKVPELSAIGVEGDPNVVLQRRAEAGITERFGDVSMSKREQIERRMRDELQTITGFGFAGYFLTVADVSKMMREMRVRNAARGSGAGSLVTYLLRISNVDPLEHDLLFERFLGNKRETLPDIDIDVESARRHEVYRAIFDRYGSNRVTLMSMQSTYRGRGAVRDAGLALGLDEHQIDLVANNVWRSNARDMRQALDEKPELREIAQLVKTNDQINLLVDLTERLDRLPRHISMHPCGVILGDSDLLSMTPVQPSGMGLPMSQFDKHDMNDAGLLKLDVLGVRMQSSLAFALDEIERVNGPRTAVAGALPIDVPYINREGRIELDAIPHDDEPTFEAIRTTHTLGMFQIESPGQRELIGKMQPDLYEDLIADISLFRPGPMKGNMIAPYLDTKHGFQQADYVHPSFAPFLQDSYGVVIYHEHVLRILHATMRISLAEADEMRRQMTKRDDLEDEFRQKTKANVDEKGRRRYTDKEIDRIWAVLKGFGSFGFCKAHGAAFALPTYQSAWLKTHYPAEFLAGILTHDPGMYPKRLLLTEARRMGIPVLPLDVNASDEVFHVERVRPPRTPIARSYPGDLGIRLSLIDVQGISENELTRVIENRPYTSIADFYQRATPSRRLLLRLAQVGALDSVAGPGRTRGDVVARVRQLIGRTTRPKTEDADNQLDFDVDESASVPVGTPDVSTRERVSDELDILSMEVSEHVVESYRPMLDALGVTRAADLRDHWNGTRVLVAGIRIATQTPPMKSGKRVVFISLDDGSGCSDSTFFEEAQQRAGSLLFGTKLMLIQGRTRRTGERGISLEAENAWDLKTLWRDWKAGRLETGALGDAGADADADLVG